MEWIDRYAVTGAPRRKKNRCILISLMRDFHTLGLIMPWNNMICIGFQVAFTNHDEKKKKQENSRHQATPDKQSSRANGIIAPLMSSQTS